MGTQDEGVQWKEEYEKCAEKLKQLEILSKDVLKEYHETIKKFEDKQTENEELHAKIKKKDEELENMKELIDPAIQEYEKLKNKYEIEKGCRYQAQSYASHMVNQNHKLKRQSMGLLSLVEKSNISIVDLKLDEDSDEPDPEKEYKEKQNTIIRELKNEVATLQVNLKQSTEAYHIEKENYKWATTRYQAVKTQLSQTEKSLKQHKEAMKELSQVSEEAYQEYESLRKKLGEEHLLRNFAEKKIGEFEAQTNMMKRQSAVLLSKVSQNEQLHKAVMEIEALSEKVENQKLEYEKQIGELMEKLEKCDESSVQDLESEKEELQNERNELSKRLADFEEKYNLMETNYDALQKKYDDAMRPPLPPPPPPPPPVKQSVGFLSKIIKPKGTKKKEVDAKLKVGGANVSSDYNKAVEEMMDKIKRGAVLRPVLKPVKKETDGKDEPQFKFSLRSRSFDDVDSKSLCGTEDTKGGGAMAELHNLMSKLKRSSSESDLLAPVETQQGDSELAKTFRRVRKKSTDSGDTAQGRLPLVSEERESEILVNPADSSNGFKINSEEEP